jgi:hypothetical protein
MPSAPDDTEVDEQPVTTRLTRTPPRTGADANETGGEMDEPDLQTRIVATKIRLGIAPNQQELGRIAERQRLESGGGVDDASGREGLIDPDQETRVAALKVQMGMRPNTREVQRLTTRQQLEATHPVIAPDRSLGALLSGSVLDSRGTRAEQDRQARYDEVQQQRQQRQAEIDQRKARNAEFESDAVPHGKRFRKDPYGNDLPVVNEKGQQLYKRRSLGIQLHPKTGEPAHVIQDELGQRQFNPLKVVVDPKDQSLKYQMPDGSYHQTQQRDGSFVDTSAGTIEDNLNSSNPRRQAAAHKANTAQIEAKHNAFLYEARKPVNEAFAALTQANADLGELNAQREKLKAAADSAAEGVDKDAAKAALSQLDTRQRDIEKQIQPGTGPLAVKAKITAAQFKVQAAQARQEAYAAKLAERAMLVKHAGGVLDTDPTHQAISVQAAENNDHLMQAQAELAAAGGTMPAAAPNGTPATQAGQKITNPLMQSEPGVAIQRGEKAVGGVGMEEFARRYGTGLGDVDKKGQAARATRLDEIKTGQTAIEKQLDPLKAQLDAGKGTLPPDQYNALVKQHNDLLAQHTALGKEGGKLVTDYNSKRFGEGEGKITPAHVIALDRRAKEIDDMLAAPEGAPGMLLPDSKTNISPVLRDSLTKEKAYVEDLAKQRLARLAPDQQKQAIDATRAPTNWEIAKANISNFAANSGTTTTDIIQATTRTLARTAALAQPGGAALVLGGMDNPAAKKIDEYAKWEKEAIAAAHAPSNPAEAKAQQHWTAQVSGMVGGVMPYMVAGAPARLAGLGAGVEAAAAGAAGSFGFGQAFRDEATQGLQTKLDAKQITPEQFEKGRDQAEALGTIVGAGMLVPFSQFARLMAKTPAGRIVVDKLLSVFGKQGEASAMKWIAGNEAQGLLRSVAERGVGGGLVGFGQTVAANLTARGGFGNVAYDEKRGIMEGATENIATMGILGAMHAAMEKSNFPQIFWKKAGIEEQDYRNARKLVSGANTETAAQAKYTPEQKKSYDAAREMVAKVESAAKNAGVKIGDIARGRVIAESAKWEPRALTPLIPEKIRPDKPEGLQFRKAEAKAGAKPVAKAAVARETEATAGPQKLIGERSEEPSTPESATTGATDSGPGETSAGVSPAPESKVDIGPRDETVSTGTGVEMPKETAINAKQKRQVDEHLARQKNITAKIVANVTAGKVTAEKATEMLKNIGLGDEQIKQALSAQQPTTENPPNETQGQTSVQATAGGGGKPAARSDGEPGIRAAGGKAVEAGQAGAAPVREAVGADIATITSKLEAVGIPKGAVGKTAGHIQNAIQTGAYGDILHPDNKHSRAVFTALTGVKLPPTVKGTQEAMQQYKATLPAKPAAEAPAVKTETPTTGTEVAAPESALGDQPVKMKVRRESTGQEGTVDLPARLAEKHIKQHIETLNKVLKCIDGQLVFV